MISKLRVRKTKEAYYEASFAFGITKRFETIKLIRVNALHRVVVEEKKAFSSLN